MFLIDIKYFFALFCLVQLLYCVPYFVSYVVDVFQDFSVFKVFCFFGVEKCYGDSYGFLVAFVEDYDDVFLVESSFVVDYTRSHYVCSVANMWDCSHVYCSFWQIC